LNETATVLFFDLKLPTKGMGMERVKPYQTFSAMSLKINLQPFSAASFETPAS
jgi:hypothetical protein